MPINDLFSFGASDSDDSGALPWERDQKGSGNPTPGSPPGDPIQMPVFPLASGDEEAEDEETVVPATSELFKIKVRVHRKLLAQLNLQSLENLPRKAVEQEIRNVVLSLLSQEEAPLSYEEKDEVVRLILDEVFGLGPLEPLLKDEGISDILVNTHKVVYIERGGKLERTGVRFDDEGHLRQIIDRIVSHIGRRIDESSPMVDARLPDGSRVNAIIPPLAIDGSHISIRKFKRDVLGPEELLSRGSVTQPMLQVLQAIVRVRLNVLISGGTGSGKTTLLNILSSFIPHDERLVTIEDSAELQLRQPHVVRLETKPSNIEGRGEITQRDLVKNALRMRPERIILGEIRSGEAVDMLQAMNTGHDGSLATLHANTPRDALARLETMIAMAGLNLPDKAMRQQVASAVNIIVQTNRLSDGSRKITHISEITGMEGEIVTMQDIFVFQRVGVDDQGRVVGQFQATGVRPKFTDLLKSHGIELPGNLFETNAY